MAMSADVIAGFTEVQAERLTGVSQRRLRYWARSSFFLPSLEIEDAELSNMQLYSFRDLACLKVISALRNEARVPLQELRRVKSRLVRLGDELWVTTTLYVLGKRVVFDNPETGGKEEAAAGQGVFQIPLKRVTGEIEQAIREMRSRKTESVGKIERKRGIAERQPIVAGTRIPVRSIKAFAEANYSIDDIIKQYPTLTRADIKAALAHEDAA
jgi:uncharacterized protein (DUF433 family)